MNYTTTTLDTFNVVGISARTTNEDNQALKDIGDLWNKFYFDNISGKIPQKLNDEIICLYTEYEKDFTKPYTVVLGYRVSTTETSEGMVNRTVSASKYAVFHVKGELPKDILKTWKWILESDLERTYTGDFEVYKSENKASIYVAIK